MSSSVLCDGRLKMLSSEALLDDEDCMHITLSQSPGSMTECPNHIEVNALRGPRLRVAAGLAMAIGLAITGAMLGCDRSRQSDITADSHAGAGPDTSAEDANDAATFVWPEDPSHPVLTLEIESDPGRGTITIELMPELAPLTVAHVIDLAKQGYYDGTTFHRVIPGFMIQGGDPNSRDRNPDNDGQGNSEISISDEFGPAPFTRGVVGMGNKGRRNSTGGQFFIMHADNRNLDGRYTVIGRVVEGMDVVDSIMKVSIDRIGRWGPKDRPIENVVMKSVAIETRETAEAQRGGSAEKLSANTLADL